MVLENSIFLTCEYTTPAKTTEERDRKAVRASSHGARLSEMPNRRGLHIRTQEQPIRIPDPVIRAPDHDARFPSPPQGHPPPQFQHLDLPFRTTEWNREQLQIPSEKRGWQESQPRVQEIRNWNQELASRVSMQGARFPEPPAVPPQAQFHQQGQFPQHNQFPPIRYRESRFSYPESQINLH